MFSRLLLLSALVPWSAASGESGDPADGPLKVWAFAGGDVVLPCTFNLTEGGDFPTVEWSVERPAPNIVLLYRDGCETHEMKNPDFEFRTSLVWRELKHGNVSLRMSSLKLSDAGTYRCKRLWRDGRRDSTAVQLFVFSEPKHSGVLDGPGGATLVCEVSYWQLEPEILFLDPRGHQILAEDPRRDDHTGGFFTVRRRASLQTGNSWFPIGPRATCRVQQLQLLMRRDTSVLLTPVACSAPCSITSCLAAVGAFLFVLLMVTGAVVIVWRKSSQPPPTVAIDMWAQSRRPGPQRQNSASGSAHFTQRPRRNNSSPELSCLLSRSESKSHADMSRLPGRRPMASPPSPSRSEAYMRLGHETFVAVFS